MAAIDTTLDAGELAKFAAMADEWWDPSGKFAPLHKFNPVRLKFIRETAAQHFSRTGLKPFEGLTLLDLGCGGGLLSEPMTRLGFSVTAADPVDQNIRIARAHAEKMGLGIDYRVTSAEALADSGAAFDVVLNMEVVEHVADLRAYLRACARLVKPGGLTFIATLNRTLKSYAMAKLGAEYILRWLPAGTHDWSKFVTPDELSRLVQESGLNPLKTQGMMFDPLMWDWRLANDVDVNYMLVASR